MSNLKRICNEVIEANETANSPNKRTAVENMVARSDARQFMANHADKLARMLLALVGPLERFPSLVHTCPGFVDCDVCKESHNAREALTQAEKILGGGE